MYDGNLFNSCTLCPRECKINRSEGAVGFCHSPAKPVVNISMLHYGEEPIISGNSSQGSGAVFFEGCSLGCTFCQNFEISRGTTGLGSSMTSQELGEEFLKLMEKGAININLVTALHYTPYIANAIEHAKNHGLTIPVVINTGGYDKVSTLKMLDGLADIYLPDMKFYSSKLAFEVCKAPNYFEVCCDAIAEMYRQVGTPIIENDIMKRGMIVRHLMLPGFLFDTKKILDYLTSTYGNNIYISLMNQYTPMPHLDTLPTQAASWMYKTLNPGHYDSAVNYLAEAGQINAFVQGEPADGNELIPDFKINVDK